MIAADRVDPWAWEPHPEVWLLVAFLVGAFVYMARVIGPHVVRPGERAVTRRQTVYFTGHDGAAVVRRGLAVHDVGEQYLYSVHMFQHMVFSYFVPPLALMATPTWMLRALLGEGRTYRTARFFTRPVIAGGIFNVMVMVLHIPTLVNTSTENGVLHYTLHLGVMLTALLMWMPVVGPLPEAQIGPGAKAIYLFLMSVVPTVPAAWLTFAEGAVYKHYVQPVRVWGLSVADDQQLAGAIMKIGGGFFLWTIVIYLFFKRFGAGFERENTYVRVGRMPRAEIVGHDEDTLTYADVTDAFDASEPSKVESTTD